MRFVHLAIAMFVLACAPAFALTNVSACGSLSGDTQFKLTADLSSFSTCLSITGVTTSLDLDCDGHSVTASSAFSYGLVVYSNNGVVTWHNCHFYATNRYGWGSPTSVNVTANVGNNPLNNWGPSTWSYSNYYYGANLDVSSTPYFSSLGDTFTNSYLAVHFSDYAHVQWDSVDNSGLTYSSGEYAGAYVFERSNHILVEDSVAIGYPGTRNPGNVDDGVIFGCDWSNSSAPTHTCVDAVVDNLVTTDMYDAGVEFVGQWDGVQVINSTFTRAHAAGIACFGNWYCSINNGYFGYNTMTASQSYMRLFYFYGHASSSSFFTNNIFEFNSINNTSTQSMIGLASNQWDTVGNNVINDNQFGSSSVVSVQGTYGFIDNGNNYCQSSSAVITCH